MFIGHYAPAAALKPLVPAVPLWHLFVAVQFLDYLWAAFILAGVEKARIVPGFLAASDLDLYYMPFTHSLAGAALWSIAGAAAYRFLLNRQAGAGGAVLIGLAIASHWLADFLVHAPDLALYPGSSIKLGLGLWSSLALSKGLELGFFLAGFLLYLVGTAPKGWTGRVAPAIVLAALLGVEVYAQSGEPPADIKVFVVLALVSFTAIAALAFLLDATRTVRER